MAILILFNNFMHDFCAAGWLFGSVVLWLMLKRSPPSGEAEQLLVELLALVMRLMRISLVGIVLFGAVRAWAYKWFEWSVEAGDGQVTLLIVKHILLTGVFIAGLVPYLKARNIVRRTPHA